MLQGYIGLYKESKPNFKKMKTIYKKEKVSQCR